jgi:hypothetical protein
LAKLCTWYPTPWFVGRKCKDQQNSDSYIGKRLLPNGLQDDLLCAGDTVGLQGKGEITSKVAVHRYYRNEFVYKNEGVGAIVIVSKEGIFLGLQARYNKML